jgi:DNA (cytosine-5)-methyltransferase 1
VQTDLENQGYEVQAYILPACGKNAPHKRERTWFIAHSISFGRGQDVRFTNGESNVIDKISETRNVTNSNSNGFQGSIQQKCNDKQRGNKQVINASEHLYSYESRMEAEGWENFPTQSPICGGDDGLPQELDNITFSKWKNESIKAYGNAIVPQVAYEIFKAIQSFEDIVK